MMHYFKSLGMLLLGILAIFAISIAIIYAGIYWNIESWPIVVSVIIGTILFFSIKKSFGEFKKINKFDK
jgi:hypothetical protein